MSTDTWRRALEVIRSRFDKAADIYPLLRNRVYEFRLGSSGIDPLPPKPFKDLDREDYHEHWGLQWRVFSRMNLIDPDMPDAEPVPWEGWAWAMIPPTRSWGGGGWFHGDGFRVFGTIAEEAFNLVKACANLLPMPIEIRSDLREFYPEPWPLIPDWSDCAYGWAHVVHWIGRENSHPVFRLDPQTWWSGMPAPADVIDLAAIRKMDRNLPVPRPDFEGSPPRLFSEVKSIFSASVWALDWLADRVGSESAHGIEGPPSTSSNVIRSDDSSGLPKAQQPQSLDSRAVGLAHEMNAKQEPINVSKIARLLGCERTMLYDLPGFSAMVKADRKSREAAKRGRPRGTKDRKTGSIEAWDEDE